MCKILFNYDIPWNPNRLEQRMGRIHRYGQRKDCLIFNFVATNTIEGRALQRLLEKLEEIRDALEDDVVFNVVGDCCCPWPISNASPVTITPAVLGMRTWKSASCATSMSANSAPFFKSSAPNARKLVRDCTNVQSEFL